jgi:hypothetical protein
MMIVVAIIFATLALLFVVFGRLDKKFNRMIRREGHGDDRLSGLEIKDYSQDARLDNHQQHIKRLHSNVKELGADIGWDDSKRKTPTMTQVVKKPPNDGSNT